MLKNACAPEPAPVMQILNPDSVWNEVQHTPLLVYFNAHEDTIMKETIEQKIRALAQYMNTHPSAHIAITGHTQMHQDESVARALGKQHAEKIKILFVSLGAAPASVRTFTRGDSMLAAPESSPDGAALNRRAVISIFSN